MSTEAPLRDSESSANNILPPIDPKPYHSKYSHKSPLDRSLLTQLDSSSISTSFDRPTIPAHNKAPLTEFKLFSRLPTELRLMIWKYILPQRRMLDVRRPQATPTILHINQESRSFAHRYYEPIEAPAPLHSCYIDWALDYVVVVQEANWPPWVLALSKLENFVICCPKWVRYRLPALPEGTEYLDFFPRFHRVANLRMCEGLTNKELGSNEFLDNDEWDEGPDNEEPDNEESDNEEPDVDEDREDIDGLIEEKGSWRFHVNLMNKMTLQRGRIFGKMYIKRTFERCQGCSGYEECRLLGWKPLLLEKLGVFDVKYTLRAE